MDWNKKAVFHLHLNKDKRGMTTIIAVCVMALVMSLSLGLFLTASVLMRTAVRSGSSEQSRILAVSLSRMLESQLTDEDMVYDSRLKEEEDRMQDMGGLSLWHYVKRNIEDGSWPYYQENGDSLHSRENAVRSFHMEAAGAAGEIADSQVSLYWTQKEGKPDRLVTETRVTVKGETCVITDVYQLQVSGGEYESWKWSHLEKR